MTVIRPLFAAFVSLSALSPAGAAGVPIFTSLDSFAQAGGAQEPSGGLMPLDGLLYGVSQVGGATGNGAIYRIDPTTGAVATLYGFRGEAESDGAWPVGRLVAADGVLYGTTTFGGRFGTGTLFAFDLATSTETVLHEFGADGDGRWPSAGPILVDGNLIGTTGFSAPTGSGIVFTFELAAGHESVLYRFSGPDGSAPLAPVIFAGGRLFGTTWGGGGDANAGIVFSLNPRSGVETVLHVFEGPSALTHPQAGLTWHDGVLYGTATTGGAGSCADGCGGVFRIDAATGVEADLHVFASPVEGWLPRSELVYDQGHVLGTTARGGSADFGTVFGVDVETGEKATLHDFVINQRGVSPGPLLGFRHALYGTTFGGGSTGQGTAFRLDR